MQISIANLLKQFGSVTALDHVDLTINDGELFFLLGPSGCGKTTLLRCIGGFEQPTSGLITMDGKDITSLPPEKRNTSMVFQGYALWPHLTVRENILFGLEMQKLSKEEIRRRADEAMAQVQITSLADRKPNELSGGQQQRVALARTIVVHPGCLLLDEPLANLDAKLRRDMRRELRSLCKENHLTAIYVTHDRQEALSMADKVAILKDGKIVQVGTPNEIYRHPVNSFVSSFIGDANFIPAVIGDSDDEYTLLESEIGPLCVPLTNLPKNSKVVISVRPEAIRKADSQDKAIHPIKNLLLATLKDTAYLGEVAQHHVLVNNTSLELDFLEYNPSGTARSGEQLSLQISPEDLIVLQE